MSGRSFSTGLDIFPGHHFPAVKSICEGWEVINSSKIVYCRLILAAIIQNLSVLFWTPFYFLTKVGNCLRNAVRVVVFLSLFLEWRRVDWSRIQTAIVSGSPSAANSAGVFILLSMKQDEKVRLRTYSIFPPTLWLAPDGIVLSPFSSHSLVSSWW